MNDSSKSYKDFEIEPTPSEYGKEIDDHYEKYEKEMDADDSLFIPKAALSKIHMTYNENLRRLKGNGYTQHWLPAQLFGFLCDKLEGNQDREICYSIFAIYKRDCSIIPDTVSGRKRKESCEESVRFYIRKGDYPEK